MEQDALRDKWDERHAAASHPGPALEVLTENAHLLPPAGDALDLACGLGASALFLAGRGLRVTAWDISPVAIERLRVQARGLSLVAATRDVVAQPPRPDAFDVIVVGHFLERGLCPALRAALRPGGALFYQTFSSERVDDSGPGDGPFRLQRNELLRLFSGLVVRYYRDEGRVGDTGAGFRNRAQLVAQRVD